MHVLAARGSQKACQHARKAPNAASPLTYTVAQPHDAAGRQRRQLIDDVSPMGSLPLRISCPLTCDSSHFRVVDGAGRDAEFLVKTTCCCSTPAAIASRGARQAELASTNRRPPSRSASAPPRARTGHPILETCEACDRAPRVPIGQASVPGRIRRGRLRAVLESLARGESLG